MLYDKNPESLVWLKIRTYLAGRKFGQEFLGGVGLAKYKVRACFHLGTRILRGDENLEGAEVVWVGV